MRSRRFLVALSVLNLAAVVSLIGLSGCNEQKAVAVDSPVIVANDANNKAPEKVEPVVVQDPNLVKTDGYGSLAGKVTLNGPLPEVINLIPAMKAKDAICCIGPKMKPEEGVDLKWVVDPKTKAVANVMVWVTVPKGKVLPVHPDYQKRKEQIELDQPHCQYLPRVSAFNPYYVEAGKKVETGQKLVFKNSAKCNHNVRVIGNGVDNEGFNLNLPSKAEIKNETLKDPLKPQKLPLEVRCDVHPWMTARLFVFDHPYYAMTNEKGEYNLPKVPAGAEVTVMAWHEGVGYVIAKTVDGKFQAGEKMTIAKDKTTTLDIELKYDGK